MWFLHRRHPIWPLVVAIAVLALAVGTQLGRLRDWWYDWRTPDVPTAVDRSQTDAGQPTNASAPPSLVPDSNANVSVTSDIPLEQSLPAEMNLDVPYTVQAPHANWDADHGEFCEEASVLMVARYFLDQSIPDADNAEAALQDIKQWEVDNLGFHKDTTAEETTRILKEKFGLKDVSTIVNPTVANIKAEVAAGNPVIIPAAGRLLGNPFYRQPGPLYHMLVVKGYTKDGRFITNDPGTKRGADYVYDAKVLMNAIHDWNDGDVANGQDIIIVVRG